MSLVKKIDKKIANFRRLKQIKETTTLSILDKDVTYKKVHLPSMGT